MTCTLRLTLLATALMTVTVLGGCNSSSIDSESLRDNWTPELASSTESYEEYYNARSRRRNNAKRQILDDWSNIWLEGRNIRMTPYVLP